MSTCYLFRHILSRGTWGAVFLMAGLVGATTGISQTRASQPPKGARTQVLAPSASFTNSTPITINDASPGTPPIPAPATPYPSSIAVSGLAGTVASVSITINGFSHTFPDDVGICLVGPTGATLLVQDGAGDDPDMNNVTYTLADSGAANLPSTTAWGPGTYKPTSYYTSDSFPAPGPGTAYNNPGPAGAGTATFGSVFGATNPNGTWKLYVVDFQPGDTGSISGGWTLTITTNSTTAATVGVSGRVTGTTGNGLRNARVTFTDSSGKVYAAVTNSFGYYSFTDLPSGSTFVTNVTARGYTFAPRLVQVFDQLSDVNFSPE